MTVRIVKLNTGEELIGNFTSRSATTESLWTVERPRIIAPVQTGPNQFGLTFIPLFMSNPSVESIELDSSHIVATMTVVPNELEREYLSATSGLDLSSKMSVNVPPIIVSK